MSNLSEILGSISSVIHFAKKNDVFIEFFIYSSDYALISSSETKTKHTDGISMLVLHNDRESFYSIDNFDIAQLLSVLKKDFDFDISFLLRDDSNMTSYGFCENDFHKSLDQAKKFVDRKQESPLTFSVSLDYEKIIVYNNERFVLDGRLFQKLYLFEDRKLVETLSSNSTRFVGENYAVQKNKPIYFSNKFSKPQSKKIVFLPKAANALVHEICGHMLEGDFYDRNNPFYNKFEKQVSPNFVTVYDSPLFFYENVAHTDDEGFELEKNYLIHNGILKQVIGSRDFGRRYKDVPYVQQGRRESHKNFASGRIYCLCLEAGQKNEHLLLSENSDAIIVRDFQKSYYNPKSQKIVFHSDNIYAFEENMLKKIDGSLKINQNGAALLANIIDISNQDVYYENMCFANSGFVSNAAITTTIVVKDVVFKIYSQRNF